jgi:nitrite reductase/ring-hydroxylating ferredoxin subunit
MKKEKGGNLMGFIDVAKTDEIAAGQMKGVKSAGKDILITNIGGKYYAIGGKCSHFGGDLSKGKLVGKIVTCPLHGSQFDVTTGKLVRGPAQRSEPAFEVQIEGKMIKVNINE